MINSFPNNKRILTFNNEFILKRTSFAKGLFCVHFVLFLIFKCINLSPLNEALPFYSAIYFSFIVVWGLFILLASFKKAIKVDKITVFLLFLVAYYVFWYFVNLSDIDKSDALNNLIRELMLVAFLFVSTRCIEHFGCVKTIIKASYWTFLLYSIVWLFISLEQIDIWRTLSTFWLADNFIRYRVYFGFLYPNLGAELCLYVILLSKIVDSRFLERKFFYWFKLLMNLLMIFMIVANNSRGTFLLLIILELVSLYFKAVKHSKLKRVYILFWSSVAILVFGIAIYCVTKNVSLLQLLSGTNRDGIVENIKVISNGNKWLFGLGRLSGGFFQAKNILYGTWTGYLEVFYFEIFITSGIVGSVYFALLLLYLFKSITKKAKQDNSHFAKWIFMIVIYGLFISLFEVYILSYIYASAYVSAIMLLLYSNGKKDFGL